jgi:hypothetical protein
LTAINNADTLVLIVAKALNLISKGEIQVQAVIPQNIASRHRICTDIASKVKSIGSIGFCGYNQLLYPVESQTKALLAWLIQKLPRTEKEVPVNHSATAVLNKKIYRV